MKQFQEPARSVPVREYDVVVAGGGTGGVVAALASARQGARTALVESKGYVGGLAVEGGTALHSFYNLWKAFPGVPKRQVVRGIPQEIIDRLMAVGAASGHGEMSVGYDYDSVCTCVDTELYKLVANQMLAEAGVDVLLDTMVVGAAVRDGVVQAAFAESHGGGEALTAKCFVDCTGYGDLAARCGARYAEPNDYPVCNSMGVAGVSMEAFRKFLDDHGALSQLAHGRRSGRDGQIIRVQAGRGVPDEFGHACHQIGMSLVTTTVHDDYFMFIKINTRMPASPTDRDALARTELELRRRQAVGIELIRKHIPGCQRAFITRTSPSVCIRRGRLIECDYDITKEDVEQARHFDDEVMVYGFHDFAPRLKVADGGTYGIPYRALRAGGLDNLLVAGMLITSNHDAHMSTRNTVCCMGQGQGAGTAAALCSQRGCTTRQLPYPALREALVAGGVYLEA